MPQLLISATGPDSVRKIFPQVLGHRRGWDGIDHLQDAFVEIVVVTSEERGHKFRRVELFLGQLLGHLVHESGFVAMQSVVRHLGMEAEEKVFDVVKAVLVITKMGHARRVLPDVGR